MNRISYRIESKILGPDGKSIFIKYGDSANIEYTIKYHQFHLIHKTHPDPQLRNYVEKYGVDSLEYIVDKPELMEIIETATVEPIKETRKGGRTKKIHI